MITQVLMPQFGESVVEGTITAWLKQVGEQVEQYEALVEVNTDKVDTEVPSPATGVLLEIRVAPGTTVQAGTVLAIIGQPGETAPNLQADTGAERISTGQLPPVSSPEHPAQAARPRMGRHDTLGFISPLVARLAAEHRVDLSQVSGSGLHGRITKQDVREYLERQVEPRHSQPAATQADRLAQILSPHNPDDEFLPLTPLRRRIAEHMVHSEHTAPHVTTVMEADLSQVTAHRQANKADFARLGANLTFSAYFVKAAAAALRAHPLVNSSWDERGIVLHHQINIGIAVALSEGLIVPAIRQADTLSLLEIGRAVNDLAERARSRKLKPEEVQGGTFTITNHGVSGSLFATPIISQPQSAILGVGAIQKRPVVVEINGADALAIRPMVYLNLTFDHRVLDGAAADHFLAQVISNLEHWVPEA
jgi:2-oxoglutarate dehydrogenase E2 component (dihydrolipoamide succinyltransferase)